jgi:hypothetical protein
MDPRAMDQMREEISAGSGKKVVEKYIWRQNRLAHTTPGPKCISEASLAFLGSGRVHTLWAKSEGERE